MSPVPPAAAWPPSPSGCRRACFPAATSGGAGRLLVYATSNRRHLVARYARENLPDEIMWADAAEELSVEETARLYDEKMAVARETMIAKNHDYGEAWRDMSQESFTDLILMKILRIRQIVANDGKTLISEGIDSNYIDIINYSLFALILIGEGQHSA